MKPRLVELVRCPLCGTRLELRVFAARGDDVIETGVLLCDACRVWYPIERFVPVLLDFRAPVHEAFASRHAGDLERLEGYGPPHGRARPGELATQKSFSAEWLTVRDDELTFTYTHPERADFIRIELDWPPDLLRGDSAAVLDVGCGYGTEAVLLNEVTGRETFATDLNLSLLDAGPALADRPGVHVAIASLFALPFEPASFGLVYSHGVLHHTFSTRAAFDAISQFVAPGGALYVWVYALDDFRGGARLRLSRMAELVLRPVLSRAPAPVQTAAVHGLSAPHFVRYRRAGAQRARWRYANSVHSVRDRWTPRYAHRHTSAEVDSWFREASLETRPVDSQAYERRFGTPLIGIGRRGRRRNA